MITKETYLEARPTWNYEMVKELAKIVGKKVNEWCNDETPLKKCIEITEKILKWHSDDNGYELAKDFENEGFYPDSELIKILHHVSCDRSKVEESFIKKWVADNNLKLELVEGQKVTAKLVRKGEVEGDIVKLYPETMQYGFWHQGLRCEKGKGHNYVNFENVVSVLD